MFSGHVSGGFTFLFGEGFSLFGGSDGRGTHGVGGGLKKSGFKFSVIEYVFMSSSGYVEVVVYVRFGEYG